MKAKEIAKKVGLGAVILAIGYSGFVTATGSEAGGKNAADRTWRAEQRAGLTVNKWLLDLGWTRGIMAGNRSNLTYLMVAGTTGNLPQLMAGTILGSEQRDVTLSSGTVLPSARVLTIAPEGSGGVEIPEVVGPTEIVIGPSRLVDSIVGHVAVGDSVILGVLVRSADGQQKILTAASIYASNGYLDFNDLEGLRALLEGQGTALLSMDQLRGWEPDAALIGHVLGFGGVAGSRPVLGVRVGE